MTEHQNAEPVKAAPTAMVCWAHRPDPGMTERDWRQLVLSFVSSLRETGVDADFDLFHLHEPGIDWTRWGPAMVQERNFVIVVPNTAWRERWQGQNQPTEGAGAVVEADTLKGLFTRDQRRFQERVVLVLLPGISDTVVPPDLHRLVRFKLDRIDAPAIEPLIRLLTGQPQYPLGEVGPIPFLPPETRERLHQLAQDTAAPIEIEGETARSSISAVPGSIEIGLDLLETERRQVTSSASASWRVLQAAHKDWNSVTAAAARWEALTADIQALAAASGSNGPDLPVRARELAQLTAERLDPSASWIVLTVARHADATAQRLSVEESRARLSEWLETTSSMLPIDRTTVAHRDVGRVVHTGELQAAYGSMLQFPTSRRWRIEISDELSISAAFLAADRTPGDQSEPPSAVTFARDVVEISALTAADLAAALVPDDLRTAYAIRLDLIPRQVEESDSSMHLVDRTRHPDHPDETPARTPGCRDLSPARPISAERAATTAQLREPRERVRLLRDLALDLFERFGVESGTVIRPDGSLEARNAAVQLQQMVHQYARHCGLLVDRLSPSERLTRARELRAEADELLAPPSD